MLYLALATFFDLLRFGLTQNALVRMLTVSDADSEKTLLGTAFGIQLKMQVLVSTFCWGVYAILALLKISVSNGYELFLLWYPLLSLASLGWNNAMALFQAKQDFTKMLWVRAIAVGGFNIYLIVNLFTSVFTAY